MHGSAPRPRKPSLNVLADEPLRTAQLGRFEIEPDSAVVRPDHGARRNELDKIGASLPGFELRRANVVQETKAG